MREKNHILYIYIYIYIYIYNISCAIIGWERVSPSSLAKRYLDISSAGSCNVQFCLQFCSQSFNGATRSHLHSAGVPYRVKIVRVSHKKRVAPENRSVPYETHLQLDIKRLLQFFIATRIETK